MKERWGVLRTLGKKVSDGNILTGFDMVCSLSFLRSLIRVGNHVFGLCNREGELPDNALMDQIFFLQRSLVAMAKDFTKKSPQSAKKRKKYRDANVSAVETLKKRRDFLRRHQIDSDDE